MTPRVSLLEQGLVVTSILGAMVLAAMALVVHHVNAGATDAGKRATRTTEIVTTLDKLQLALRDGELAGRDVATARSRVDVDRYDNARFQARLNLAALGPLTSDEPSQSERLSRLTPLVNRQFAAGSRALDGAAAGARDDVDSLIGSMRDDAGAKLRGFRDTQVDASGKSTLIMVGSLTLVSLLSLVFWLLLKIEFAARRALEARLIASATTDELTGVANRSDFDHKLVEEWAFRARYATALSLLLVGVDHMKQLNDAWGPVVGDAILREAARRLASRLSRNERLARSGGDEFAILVPRYRREAIVLAEQLRSAIVDAPFLVQAVGGPTSVRVTVSIGVAEASDIDEARELLAAAEEALHAAKERGRDRVQSYRIETTMGAMRATTAQRARHESVPAAHDAVTASAAAVPSSTSGTAAAPASSSGSASSPYSVSNASASRPFSHSQRTIVGTCP